jgi:aminoglycoside phosphotransferase (APT) family kinase protein
LTPAVVTDVLRARLDPLLECATVERGPMGNAQEVWFVDASARGGADRQFVLRRSAGGGALEDSELGLEFTVLGALAERGFPVPRVHFSELDSSSLGRPYFVMDRVPGTPVGHVTPEDRDSVARELGAWLARLHAVDPAELAPTVPRAEGTAAATHLELARWERVYLRRRPGPVPLLGALLAWLGVHVPADDGPPRLLWGDAGPHNILVDGPRITGLLDWELAHVGDPLEDLGAAVWACLPGTLDPDEVVAGYEHEAGPVDRERLRYFEAFACATRSVMVVAGVDAFLKGEAGPPAAALGQHLLLANLERAASLLGWARDPGDHATAPALRPDAPEMAAGVARYLRERVLGAVSDPRARRELRNAAALLDTVALRAGPDLGDDDLALEDAATRAERERSPARAGLRSRLLAGLAAQQTMITPLDDLYRPRG